MRRWNLVKAAKYVAAALGVVLWVGALCPEIFIKSGDGCIVGENGVELTAQEARAFMESYFYGDDTAEIRYKIALFEMFR